MNKIEKLEHKIVKHKTLYYQGKPEISDLEYDKIEDELRAIAPTSPILKMVGSGHFASEKIPHKIKMLSLNKTYKLEELMRWKGEEDILSTFKIDGSSCSLVYEDGILQMAKTRGDGKFGENISNKVMLMPGIPKAIEMKEPLEIRGEIFCDERSFIDLSKLMVEEGYEAPSSQRNIVAGLLGRKETIKFSRYLRFQAFELIAPGTDLNFEAEKLKKLSSLGFETPDFFLHQNEKSIVKRLQEAQSFMMKGDYLIDGLVFSLNRLVLHDKLGETAHHPRYKMAYKFQGETKQSKIKSLSWQVSRNGILTPVANIELVELSGAKVSRVTLHNYGMVKQYKLKAGDVIEIVRSGEVIPKFLSVVSSSEHLFQAPSQCPSCSGPLLKEEIRLLCKNPECPDKIKDDILNFVKKMGIDDLSSKRLEEMIRAELVRDIPSLYKLKKTDLLKLDKVKDKLAEKLIKNIEGSKSVDLITFLSSLGVNGGAYNRFEKIVTSGYDNLEKILSLSPDDLKRIDSFAEKSSNDIVESLQSKSEIIEKLKSYGFNPTHSNANPTKSEIVGLKFCVTGTLSMKRADLQSLIKKHGGVVQSSVTGETDFLVTNDTESSSSKFKKAQQLEIPIISESKLLELIG